MKPIAMALGLLASVMTSATFAAETLLPGSGTQRVPDLNHVFVIVMENYGRCCRED